MNGVKRGTVGMDILNDEIRVAYLAPDHEDEAVHMAQLEWVSCLHRLVTINLSKLDFECEHHKCMSRHGSMET